MKNKVLIIDNASSCGRRALPLNEEDYSIDFARNADEGLQKLNSLFPDLIVVRETPEAESWQLCQRIRRVSGTPLIVISTNASIETAVKAIKAGADYFMRKPFGPLEFLARVQSLLRHVPVNQSKHSYVAAS